MEPLDHRRLAHRLDLYHIDEDAPGMVFWHADGFRLYRTIETYIRRQMGRLGYREVRTPQLLPRDLWERSGHWEKYHEHMYRLPEEHGRELALKPMSCPAHVAIFNNEVRSWRDLPLRYAEFGLCHRNEASGAVHGLLRTKAFEQDDAHVLCLPEQVQGEIERFVRLLERAYHDFGFTEHRIALSTRPAKRAGSDAQWDWAESTLAEAAAHAGIRFEHQPGEGAFYGPKLEFALHDRQGRLWQCGTVQLDCVLPARLGAQYIAASGARETPVMVHHAVLGSIGRFIGILLEQHAGRLPFWLAPRQIAVMPIGSDQQGYAAALLDRLREADLSAALYPADETLSRRLARAHDTLIPLSAIVGAREVASDSVTLREVGGTQRTLPVAEAVARLRDRAAPP